MKNFNLMWQKRASFREKEKKNRILEARCASRFAPLEQDEN